MPGHNDLPCADPINLSAAPARPDNPHHPQGLAKTRVAAHRCRRHRPADGEIYGLVFRAL